MPFLNPENVIKAIGVSAGMKIADFGCGPGFYSIPLGRAVGGTGRVFAFDVQKSSVELVRSKAKAAHLLNIAPMWADLDSPGGSMLADASVSGVLISNILFQTDHKKTMLGEAFRIAASGGFIAVIDWEASLSGGPAPDRLFRREEAEKMLEETGFRRDKEFFAGDHHYGLLFLKP